MRAGCVRWISRPFVHRDDQVSLFFCWVLAGFVTLLWVFALPSATLAQSAYSQKAQNGFHAYFCAALASMEPDLAETDIQRRYYDYGTDLLISHFHAVQNDALPPERAGPPIASLDELDPAKPPSLNAHLIWTRVRRGIQATYVEDAEGFSGQDRRNFRKKWVRQNLDQHECIEEV